MAPLVFLKMHGIGNDFVVLDARKTPVNLALEQVGAIANRRTGVGCDQLVVIESSDKADCRVIFYNPDGSVSSACGNATRCIAWLMMEETGKDMATLESAAGLLHCRRAGEKLITVDMGKARTSWNQIPLSSEQDTLSLKLEEGILKNPTAISMGNPHAVFFVEDTASIPLEILGPKLEHNPIFPERANIGVAEVKGKDHLNLRVWERGAGETLACGTGACAAAVAAHLRGLTGPNVRITLPGGELSIRIGKELEVEMTGPVATSFKG